MSYHNSESEFNYKLKKRKKLSFKQCFTGEYKNYFIYGSLIALVCLLAVGGLGFLLGYNGVLDDGFQRGYNEGHTEGYADGLEEGQLDGYDIGYEEGAETAKADALSAARVSSGESDKSEENVQNPAESGTEVYATASGSKYHKAGCGVIAGKDNLRALSPEKAAEEGLTPCSKCFSD